MLVADVDRYISLRQALGFKLRDISRTLRAFARFAADRGDTLTVVVHCRQVAAVTREAFALVKTLGNAEVVE